jgi:hypothetical protein
LNEDRRGGAASNREEVVHRRGTDTRSRRGRSTTSERRFHTNGEGERTMKKILVAALGLGMTVAFGSVAFARECPARFRDFTAELEKSTKPADVKDKAKALADDGMKDHQAGRHADSVKKINEAREMIK